MTAHGKDVREKVTRELDQERDTHHDDPRISKPVFSEFTTVVAV